MGPPENNVSTDMSVSGLGVEVAAGTVTEELMKNHLSESLYFSECCSLNGAAENWNRWIVRGG